MNPTGKRWLAYLLLMSGMAVVGSYVALSKILVAQIPVYLLSLLRFGIGALVMLPVSFPQGGWAQVKRHKGTLFLQSFFGNFLFSICMLSGVARTTAGAAGLIMSTLPAVVALFSAIALRERVNWRTSLAVILAVVGVAALTLQRTGDTGQSTSWIGNGLVLAAVCCEAAYVILGKRLTSAKVPPMQICAWINLVGLALVLPFGLWQAASYPFALVSSHIWVLLGVYAVCASLVSTWLWLSGLKVVPANQAGVFTVALPISAALVGVLFLGEHVSFSELFAFACASAGIVLVATAAHPPSGS